MVDLSQYKVPVFTGKNDTPREPTAELEGNSSDMIARFNGLVDALGGLSTGQQVMTNHLDLYVDSVNGLDTNDGLTVSTALQTLAAASQRISRYFNPQGFIRRIILKPGTHNGCYLPSYLKSHKDDNIIITSNGGDEAITIIKGSSPIIVSGAGTYFLDNLTIDGNNQTAICVDNAKLKLSNLIFGASDSTATYHIHACNSAVVEILGNYSINGGSITSHLYLDALSFIDTSCFDPNRTVGIQNNTSFSSAFVSLSRGSYMSAKNLVIQPATGVTTTGKKYSLNGRSVLDTGTGNANLLPGDTVGEILDTDSKYY